MVQQAPIDVSDGGFNSRKFWLTIIIIAILCITAILATYWSGLQALYTTLSGSLLGALGIHAGGDVGAKYVLGKHAVGMAQVNAGAGDDSDDDSTDDDTSDDPWEGPEHSGPEIGDPLPT